MSEAAVSVGGVPISRVERPADRAELAALLAGTSGPVVPAGGERWNGITGPLAVTDGTGPLGLDVSRLDRVVDFQPEDLTITVEAGMRMNALTLKLAGAGLCVPLATGGFELSVGTVVAEARRTAQAVAYDGPRRHLLGLSVVDGTGVERRAGGRVVKNVAGYDLMKLHTGARETLGVLATLTLRLTPLPEIRRQLHFTLPGPGAIDALTRRIVGSDLSPSAYTVRLETAGETPGGTDGETDAPLAAPPLSGRLEFDGFDEDTALQRDLAIDMITAAGGTLGDVTELAGRDAGRRLFEPLHDPAPDALVLALPSLSVEAALSVVMWHGGGMAARLDPMLASGCVSFALGGAAPPGGAGPHGLRAELANLDRLRAELATHGVRSRLISARGSEEGPEPLVLDPLVVDGPVAATHPLMVAIKGALDPGRRLSPGLHFWGL